jgi:exodeoxyribonuclease VII large subunit
MPLLWTRLQSAGQRRLTRDKDRLANLEKLRQSLNPRRPLDLGFALVRKADHSIVRSAANLGPGDWVSLQFGDGERNAVVDDSAPPAVGPPVIAASAPPKPARPKPTTPKPDQGDLF